MKWWWRMWAATTTYAVDTVALVSLGEALTLEYVTEVACMFSAEAAQGSGGEGHRNTSASQPVSTSVTGRCGERRGARRKAGPGRKREEGTDRRSLRTRFRRASCRTSCL